MKKTGAKFMVVSGVGGKLALSILSGLAVDNFCRAVAEKNIAALSKISGWTRCARS